MHLTKASTQINTTTPLSLSPLPHYPYFLSYLLLCLYTISIVRNKPVKLYKSYKIVVFIQVSYKTFNIQHFNNRNQYRIIIKTLPSTHLSRLSSLWLLSSFISSWTQFWRRFKIKSY